MKNKIAEKKLNKKCPFRLPKNILTLWEEILKNLIHFTINLSILIFGKHL